MQCSICKNFFSKTSTLVAHKLSEHQSKSTFKCLKCDFYAPSLRGLQNHKKICTFNNLLSGNESLFEPENIEIDEEEYAQINDIQNLISDQENCGKNIF